MKCPYCSKDAYHVTGDVIGKKASNTYWLCAPCEAYALCKDNSEEMVEMFANGALREIRCKVQSAVSKLQNKHGISAEEIFTNLSRRLNMPFKQCRINNLNTANTIRARDFLRRWLKDMDDFKNNPLSPLDKPHTMI